MRDAVERADWKETARLLREEWTNRRRNAPGITTPLIDRLITTTRRSGALARKSAEPAAVDAFCSCRTRRPRSSRGYDRARRRHRPPRPHCSEGRPRQDPVMTPGKFGIALRVGLFIILGWISLILFSLAMQPSPAS